MTIWTENIDEFIDIYNDKLITKNLNEEIYNKFGNNIIYDLRELYSIQLVETIDLLKDRKNPHMLISFSLENVGIINSIYKTNPVCFSIEYNGTSLLECLRLFNVEGISNILVKMNEDDVDFLNNKKPKGKQVVTRYLTQSSNCVLI